MKRLFEADSLIRTIRAKFIEARGINISHQQAGYMRAILSLTSLVQSLARWEETIYGLSPNAVKLSLRPCLL